MSSMAFGNLWRGLPTPARALVSCTKSIPRSSKTPTSISSCTTCPLLTRRAKAPGPNFPERARPSMCSRTASKTGSGDASAAAADDAAVRLSQKRHLSNGSCHFAGPSSSKGISALRLRFLATIFGDSFLAATLNCCEHLKKAAGERRRLHKPRSTRAGNVRFSKEVASTSTWSLFAAEKILGCRFL